MMIATYTAEQVQRDALVEHLSKLLEMKAADLTSTRNATDQYYELKIRVPLDKGNTPIIEALSRLSADAALG